MRVRRIFSKRGLNISLTINMSDFRTLKMSTILIVVFLTIFLTYGYIFGLKDLWPFVDEKVVRPKFSFDEKQDLQAYNDYFVDFPNESVNEIKSCLSPDLLAHEKFICRFHTVVIDAGSTGTRVHIFEFSHSVLDGQDAHFKLERETFDQVTPGLSSYLSDAKKAANSVLPLLKKAKHSVPKSQWIHTPLILRATAGLRLLDNDKADAIINEVIKLFDSSGFLTNEESVSIMTGVDEGIFGWFTLNFLLNRLVKLKRESISNDIDMSNEDTGSSTAAALDLGGGSTQITFHPNLNKTLRLAPNDHLKQLRLFSKNVDLYTHSYLGNGLMASRLGALRLHNDQKLIGNFTTHFFTNCLPVRYSLYWSYNNVDYKVSGLSNYSYETCFEEQRRFVESSNVYQPKEILKFDIYAFGYFFDRARQARLIEKSDGIIFVGDFAKAAKLACFRKNILEKDLEQWKCRDLAYIVALLKSYGLSENTQIHLVKRIRSMEMSWALGASYHLLNTYHESRRKTLSNLLAVTPPIRSTNETSCLCRANEFGLKIQRDERRIGGVASPGTWLNLSTVFLCTRLYYGLVGLLSATAQLA